MDSGSGQLDESASSALFIGPMIGVRIIATDFAKRSSVIIKTKNLDTVINSNTTGSGETDDEASDVENILPVPSAQ